MYFELKITIQRPQADVFAFLRDKDKYPQESDSPVLVLEKTTPGAPAVGTCYREVVQMLPFYQGEIMSEITRFEPYEHLEEDFRGAGMHGHLAYHFIEEPEGTTLIQLETLHYQSLMRLFEPIIRLFLYRRLTQRLMDIKEILEGDYVVAV